MNVIDVQDLPPVWLYIPTALEHPDETPEVDYFGIFCRSFLRHFNAAISNHLSIEISLPSEWMVA